MKRLIVIAAFFPLAAFAQGTIVGSRHNLAAGSADSSSVNGTSDQICIYCHTPHRANTTRLLWNHQPSSVASYNWTDATTTAGTTLPTTQVGMGESGMCLSCHDASMSIGDVWNAGGGVSGNIGPADPSLPYQVGASGNMTGNHPIAIGYPGYAGSAILAGDTTRLAFYRGVVGTGCSSPSGICTTGATGSASINIKGTAAAPTVHCGTCHDPHGVSGNPYFLRVPVTGSTLCLACHNK